MNTKDATTPTYPLGELCILADLPLRTVRYYVQVGLVDRPEGETRAARYTTRHLDQLLLIKKWTTAGLSLERIRDLLHGGQAPVPPRARIAGSVEVCSHLIVCDGIEVVIEPGRAGWSPEQVRSFVQGVMAVHAQISGESSGSAQPASAKAKKTAARGGKNGTA